MLKCRTKYVVQDYKNSESIYSVTAQVSDSCLHSFGYSVGIEADRVDTPKLLIPYYFQLKNSGENVV